MKKRCITITGLIILTCISMFSQNWPEWTGWAGPYSNMLRDTSDQLELTDNISNMTNLWKSEDYTYQGRSQARRYGCNYGKPNPFGGAGSPIVYKNRIYLFYFRPTGNVYDTSKYNYILENCDTTRYEYHPWVDFWKLDADDIVVCIDIYTGKTIWKKVFEKKGLYNPYDYTKGGVGSYNIVAGDGKVYATGSTGRVYCLDAMTGEVEWENHVGGYHFFLEEEKRISLENWAFAGGMMYSRGKGCIEYYKGDNSTGVVVTMADKGDLVAFRAGDGEKLWYKSNVIGGNAHPSKYYENGMEYIVVAGATSADSSVVRMIEPVSGNELWTRNDLGSTFHSAFVYKDTLVCFTETDDPGHWTRGTQGAFHINTSGISPLWETDSANSNNVDSYTYHKGYLFSREMVASNLDGIRIVKLSTGEILKKHEIYIQATGQMMIADDKLYFEHDGNHGGSNYVIYDVSDPVNITEIGSWYGTGDETFTSGYERSMPAPLVKGRLFRRQKEGIYAYDMRVPGEAPDINLVNPTRDTTIDHNTTITLRAEASDNGNIEKVIFYSKGYVIGEDDTAPYEINWGNRIPGEYWIYAVALDNEGYDNPSEVINITVEPAICSAEPDVVTYNSPDDSGKVETATTELNWNWNGDWDNIPEGYDVYFGTDPNPPLVTSYSHMDDTVYVTGTLELATDYYWRIDAKNSCGTSQGDVQTFKSKSPAGFRFLRASFYKGGGIGATYYEINWLDDGEEVIPNLTGNNDQGMTVTASTNGTNAYLSYDGDGGTGWGNSSNCDITIDVGDGNEVLPDSIVIPLKAAQGRTPDSVILEGSYLGTDWYRLGKIVYSGDPMSASLDTSYYDPSNQKQSQTITFDSIPDKTLGIDTTFILNAEASSDLPLSFTSSDISVATVSGYMVTIVGVGTTNITAKQEGNDEYYPAYDEVQPLTVLDIPVKIKAVTSSEILVYPNPTEGIITVKGLTGKNSISIMDLTGIILRQIESVDSQVNIEMSTLPTGIYLIKINNNETAEIIKIIKK